METAPQALERLRTEIDRLDRRILELLAARFEQTAQVGQWKAAIGEAATKPERQHQRKAILHEACSRLGLNQDMVLDIYARISREVVAGHIARGAAAGTATQT